MNIPKAIEILKDILDDAKYGILPDEEGALKLGIEALERCEEAHRTVYLTSYKPLPGETEE